MSGWRAGADGCRSGWCVALRRESFAEIRIVVVRTTAGLFDLRHAAGLDSEPVRIVVDLPIGLLSEARAGGRTCEQEARTLVGPRRNSVFFSPARCALAATSHAEASRLNAAGRPGLKLSAQCYGLFPKIREVDALITPELQEARIREGHPECSFAVMNDDEGARFAKSKYFGMKERLRLLRDVAGYGGVEEMLETDRAASDDDVLDAVACLWTAERIDRGEARILPSKDERDERGLRMAIHA
jgi:predicted RNase H-like nuclease